MDYLIGSDEAGSQPIRELKAKGGGELYIWKNSFGRCLGGRHELVANKGTARALEAKKVSKEERNGLPHSREMVNYSKHLTAEIAEAPIKRFAAPRDIKSTFSTVEREHKGRCFLGFPWERSLYRTQEKPCVEWEWDKGFPSTETIAP